MQAPSEADVARKEALLRRARDHAAWKASFFQSRPTPNYLPKSRPRREPIAAAPTHALLARAREIAAAGGPPPAAPGDADECGAGDADGAVAQDGVAGRRAAWRRRMRAERERRNPYTDVKIISVPSRTVVVAGLHSKTVEEDVRLFGEQFGRVVSVRLVRDRMGSSRRYAFVHFGLETEARRAVAQSRKRRIHGKPVVVDMERGRTESGFLPARLAQAQRVEDQCRRDTAQETRKAPANKEEETKEGKTWKVGLPTAPDSIHTEVHEEVDALLEDIMNIT